MKLQICYCTGSTSKIGLIEEYKGGENGKIQEKSNIGNVQ
jgi:hypothetical protein